MPFYEYENLDTGKRDCAMRPVDMRDQCPLPGRWKRITVPKSLAVSGAAVNDESSEYEMARYYREQEIKDGLSGFTEQEKKDALTAWKE